ncbi:MAG: LPXTG cell wall anchor domain-containing protein, partial [Coriobacteriales bacterium]|nr:LPXTG cell wall anchor domain-containing protein [Coriobacteriales bacterium]
NQSSTTIPATGDASSLPLLFIVALAGAAGLYLIRKRRLSGLGGDRALCEASAPGTGNSSFAA